MKPERNIKKLGNLLIRQPSAKRKEQVVQKKASLTGQVKTKRLTPKLQMNREMIEAENLNQEQIKAISRQANKIMNKKVKAMQTKVSGGLVEMLESQCQKLGVQLEKQRSGNYLLQNENIQLRRAVQNLNKKLSEHNKQNNQLIQENDHADIKVQQAKDEIQRVKLLMRKRQQQLLAKVSLADLKYQKLVQQFSINKQLLQQKSNETDALKVQLQELTEQLEHYRGQGQKIKQNSDHKLKEFNKLRLQMQTKHKLQIEKKNEKIIKYQMEAQQLEQKLKQQQNVRKKMSQRGKQLQKQLAKKNENIRQLNSQVTMSKKRINDLNILKSSNKTILDEKINKLMDQNQKLKKQLSKIKKGSKSMHQEQDVSCKPQMFQEE